MYLFLLIILTTLGEIKTTNSMQKYEKKQLNSICSEFAQHKKIIGKKMPIFAQEYKIAK